MRAVARRVRRPRADRRDLPARSSGSSPTTAQRDRRRAPAVQLPAASRCRGTPRTIAAAIDRLRGALLPATAGRTGCSATTTSRASPSRVGRAQARVAAMLLLTLRGTPTLYYGDELGMQRRADPAGARAGSRRKDGPARARPRPGAHADAVGRLARGRVHRRDAVAAGGRRPRADQRRGAARRPGVVAARSTGAARAAAVRARAVDRGLVAADGRRRPARLRAVARGPPARGRPEPGPRSAGGRCPRRRVGSGPALDGPRSRRRKGRGTRLAATRRGSDRRRRSGASGPRANGAPGEADRGQGVASPSRSTRCSRARCRRSARTPPCTREASAGCEPGGSLAREAAILCVAVKADCALYSRPEW